MGKPYGEWERSTMCKMGKSTISTGSFSRAMSNYQRVDGFAMKLNNQLVGDPHAYGNLRILADPI